MLGFKIFDQDDDGRLNPLFNLCIKDNLCLEIALYNDKADSFIERMNNSDLYNSIPNKSIHLNYNKYLVNNIKEEKFYNNFLQELDYAKQLKLNRAVIHYQSPHNFKIHLENFEKEAIKQNLSILYKVAQEQEFTFYIENTFIFKMGHSMNNLVSHKILWDTILELNYQDCIGICLDWGHVKAFTEDSLTSWLNYVKYLKTQNMPIYMHIHDNNSKKDQHLSLKQSLELDLHQFNHPEDKYFLEHLNEILEYFKDDSLILEYSSDIAEEHYVWTKEAIQ